MNSSVFSIEGGRVGGRIKPPKFEIQRARERKRFSLQKSSLSLLISPSFPPPLVLHNPIKSNDIKHSFCFPTLNAQNTLLSNYSRNFSLASLLVFLRFSPESHIQPAKAASSLYPGVACICLPLLYPPSTPEAIK